MSLTSKGPEPAQDGMPTTRGMNFFLEDRNLQFLCGTIMGAPTFERARPHLVEMGEVAGGDRVAEAHGHTPTVRRDDDGDELAALVRQVHASSPGWAVRGV